MVYPFTRSLAAVCLLIGCRGGPGPGQSSETDGETESDSREDDDDADSDTEDDADSDGLDVDLDPAPGGMRRLLAHEYVGSIEVLLGPEAAAAAAPPSDVAQGGFDAIAATELSISTDPIEAYERSANAVAQAAVDNPGHLIDLVGCVDGGGGDCYAELAATLGRLSWRRPLADEEIESLVTIAEQGRQWDGGAFMTGVRYMLVRLLQSPNFLYLVEVGEEDEATGLRKLGPYEVAARLSFFLHGRTPSVSLLDAAQDGALDDADGIRDEAEAMLGQPRARVAVATFFDELFRLRFLATTSKNAEIYPQWNETVAASARQETQRLIEDIVWDEDADFRTLFSADYTFVDDTLAALYGMDPPGTNELTRVPWPASQHRAGYTSQASFLSVQASALRNKPTKRGKFVQTFILCNEVLPPPDGAIPELPEPQPDQTLREQLELHMEEPTCAACHGFTDPIGFAFENYDGVGAYRTEDNGQPIDASGDVASVGEWNDAAELGQVLATHENTAGCMIGNVIKGRIGHEPGAGEEAVLEEIETAFADEGYSLQRLLVEMAASPLFIYVGAPK